MHLQYSMMTSLNLAGPSTWLTRTSSAASAGNRGLRASGRAAGTRRCSNTNWGRLRSHPAKTNESHVIEKGGRLILML